MTDTAPQITDPADENNAETTYTWNNWKGHGRPQNFAFWGMNRTSPDRENGQFVASVDTSNKTWYVYKDARGETVFSGGVATKFWATPLPEIKVEDGKAPRKVARQCACECGEMTKPGKIFVQGHDAKMAAKLFREWNEENLTAVEAVEIMEKFSPLLAQKLAARIARTTK